MKLTFKDDLHSRNLVDNQVTSRLRNVPKIIKIDQYLLFFIDVLAEAKCGGRPLDAIGPLFVELILFNNI